MGTEEMKTAGNVKEGRKVKRGLKREEYGRL